MALRFLTPLSVRSSGLIFGEAETGPVLAGIAAQGEDDQAIFQARAIVANLAALAATGEDDQAEMAARWIFVSTASIEAVAEDDAGGFAGVYDPAVWRGLAADFRGVHQQGGTVGIDRGSGWSFSARLRDPRRQPWQQGDRNAIDRISTWKDSPRLTNDFRSAFEQGEAVLSSISGQFANLDPRKNQSAASWQNGSFGAKEILSEFAGLPPCKDDIRFDWSVGAKNFLPLHMDWQEGQPLARSRREPWQEARLPRPGRTIIIIPPGPPPEAKWHGLRFFFTFAQSVPGLVFGRAVVPYLGIRRVYIVHNAVMLKRLADDIPIEAKRVSLSADEGSWGWSFSAEIPYPERAKVDPVSGPVEIEIDINGFVWRVMVEKITENRKFAANTISISGRSLSAWLADPYAPQTSKVNAVDRNAHQLADDWLEYTDWTLDWQCQDWLVLAGAYSADKARPIEGISTLAAAAGGYLQSNRWAKTLHALARYPYAPWEWSAAVPDAVVQTSALRSLSRQWNEKPAYNAVPVSGQQSGVAATVRRAGTAGDIIAPAVTDPLITHADAARARGLSILADTGRQALITLDLPIYADLGLLEPGRLARIDDGAESWFGLSRAIAVSAEWREGLTVNQSVELERHYL